jgi:hypothetical protein
MMYALECGDYNDILSWNVDGDSFNIHNAKLFEEQVLPELFKEAKFASFRRKVCLVRMLTRIEGGKKRGSLAFEPPTIALV